MSQPGDKPFSFTDLAAALSGERKGDKPVTLADLAARLGGETGDLLKRVTQAVLDPRPPLLLTDALIRAAVLDTFSAEELRALPDELPGIVGGTLGLMLQGQRRLQLRPDVRADVIRRAREAGRLDAVLTEPAPDAASVKGTTPEEAARRTHWLRSFLAAQTVAPAIGSLADLRAAVCAREALGDLPVASVVPSAKELRRQLDLAELLEPMRILIGSTGGANGVPRTDRFVGRSADVRSLRIFVDELASEDLSESLSRKLGYVANALQYHLKSVGAGAFVIGGRGGMGKSALMAKFMLDHALNQARPFPFAYLDFDRAALQPRDPLALIGETIRQVALQFPAMEEEAAVLRQQLRSAGSPTALADSCDSFRRLLDRHVFARGATTFLLVLDTMELVQRNQRALDGVLAFVNALGEGPFWQLRIVAAGRAMVPELVRETRTRAPGQKWALGPLPVDDARGMADELGRQLLGDAWNRKWAGCIGGGPKDPPVRREPLAIRVGVDILRSTPAERREAMAQEIAKLGTRADEQFIAALYERVLDHVQDEDAKLLAWPGIIFRRFTLELAHALAPLCGLKETRVVRAFQVLATEVWIVEKDGDALIHRPELRADTLPLLFQRDEDLFTKINTAAISYFGARTTPADRAEWIYHRLLGGEPIELVEHDWDDDVVQSLVKALDDLWALRPREAAYLYARVSPALAPPDILERMGPTLAFDHVARAAPQLGELNDWSLHPALVALSGHDYSAKDILSEDGRLAACVIAVKTGRWDLDDDSAGARAGRWAEMSAFAVRFKRARRLGRITQAGESNAADVAEDLQQEGQSATRTSERSRFSTTTQDLVVARILDLPVAASLDVQLGVDLGKLSRPTREDLVSLRMAALVTRVHLLPIVQAWVNARCGATSTPSSRTVAGKEIATLQGRGSTGIELQPLLAPLLVPLKLTWATVVSPDHHVRISDPAICSCVEQFVLQLAMEGNEADAAKVRHFMAVRSPDWLMPLAYSVARLYADAPIPPVVLKRLDSYEPGQNRREIPRGDFLQALRTADEAGELSWAMDALLKNSPRTNKEEEHRVRKLLEYLGTWRDNIRVLHTAAAPVVRSRTRPEPGPIVHRTDLQKDRWGSSPERDGRRLSATITEIRRNYFLVDLTVSSEDGTTLEGPVVFHLHDTFPRTVIHIRKIRDGLRATLFEVSAYEAFTVGAQVLSAQGQWVGLELDLETLAGLPWKFRGKPERPPGEQATPAGASGSAGEAALFAEGNTLSASVLSVSIAGLTDLDEPRGLAAMSTLHSILRTELLAARLPGARVLSSLTGALLLLPDSTNTLAAEDFARVAGLLVSAGVPIRTGLAHGFVELLIDEEGSLNVVGVCVNVAARLSGAAENACLLVHESYASHFVHLFQGDHWLNPARRRPVEVRGKRDETLVAFAPPPGEFPTRSDCGVEPAWKVPPVDAVLLAYHLPAFSDSDASLLASRFRGVVQEVRRLRGTGDIPPEAQVSFSLGGDGAILALAGMDKGKAAELAGKLGLLLEAESSNRSASADVRARISAHYGPVSYYESADGIRRPTGPTLFDAQALASDEIARQFGSLVVSAALFNLAALGSRAYPPDQYVEIPPLGRPPELQIRRFVRLDSVISAMPPHS